MQRQRPQGSGIGAAVSSRHRRVCVAKVSRGSSKKTSRTSARRGATKAARPASRAATKAKPAKAQRAPARPVKLPKSTAKNGTPVRIVPAAKGRQAPAAKESKPAGRKKRRSSRIEVKVGSFGGGLNFLGGKPGSSGDGSRLDPKAPRLTRTRLTTRELRDFRELLLAKRRQLLGDMETMENEALRTETSNLSHLPVHMADMGTDNYEQEFTLSLVDRERKLVDEIDRALVKIDQKTFGICEGTGQMIAKERLEAQPWARFSIEWARHLQRPGMRR